MEACLLVRPARPADRELLLDLWERSVRATHDFLSGSDIDALRPAVAAELASDDVAWWVLHTTAGTTLGFLGYTPGTIEALFIDPDHRGQGAGTRLVDHARALADGALAVSVNEANTLARAFYEAKGFVVTGRSPTDADGRPFPLLHLVRHEPPSDSSRHFTPAIPTSPP